MELHFDAMLCSNLGNENYVAGRIKCSHRPHLARRLQVPHPCYRYCKTAQFLLG